MSSPPKYWYKAKKILSKKDPVLKKIKVFMKKLDKILFVNMTGSGSTIVGYFISKKAFDTLSFLSCRANFVVTSKVLFFRTDEDLNTIKSIKGIGLKTAQRLIIELKDKVDIFEKNDLNSAQEKFNVKSEALKALEVLGFSRSKSEKVVNEIYFNDKNIKWKNANSSIFMNFVKKTT